MGLSFLPPMRGTKMLISTTKTQKKVSAIKKKIILGVLFILTGVFVFTTANVEEQILFTFFGSVAGFSLLTVIFFIASMLKEQSWKETVKPYVVVFGLLLFWSLLLAGLRLAFGF